MKRRLMKSLIMTMMVLSLALMPARAVSQENNNTASGQMKKSGSEVKQAGTSMGHNVRHGRILRGGKHFGKHMGQAGRHFGRGTKRAIKHVIS